MQQWLRKIRITFGGEATQTVVNPGGQHDHELKVDIQISKGISASANTAQIRIWNLNPAHRSAVGKELDEMTIEAGYLGEGGGNIGILFAGQIRDVEHSREGADIVTTISCGDGDKALRNATISKSYPKGTSVETVVEGIYAEFAKQGVTRGEWVFPAKKEDYKRPYAMCGSCMRELNTIGRGKGFYWSIQNGVMEIVPGDGHLPGTVLLSQNTGLIGVPTLTDNGIKAHALLNPEVRPGRMIHIESKTLGLDAKNGIFRVGQVDYSGDNYSGVFEMAVHGENIDGSKVDEGKKA